MTITIKDIEKLAINNKFPNKYPDIKFRKEHWKIIAPFNKYIRAYKSDCYEEINNYYRTGKLEIKLKPNCIQTFKKIDSTLSPEEVVKLIIKKLDELYNLIKPFPEDIIVYRG